MTDTLTEALIGADYLEREGQATCEAVRELATQIENTRRDVAPSQQAPDGWHWVERLFYQCTSEGHVPTWDEVIRGTHPLRDRRETFFIDGAEAGKFL